MYTHPTIAFVGMMFKCLEPIARYLDILLIEVNVNAECATSTPLAKGTMAHTRSQWTILDPIPYRTTETTALVNFRHWIDPLLTQMSVH